MAAFILGLAAATGGRRGVNVSGWLERLGQGLFSFLPVLAVLAATVVVLMLVSRLLRRRWRDNPDLQFRYQLIMLALTFAGGLAILVALPVSDTLRGQLLGLIGILLSAAIALSSTTFIGNIMAGIMLKAVRSIRPGDFVTVVQLTGRVTEMDLLHTEIQTEDRDLVTVPNLYMVTNPMKVVRASGTIVSAEVSLGYDIPRTTVTKLLREAAAEAGLSDAFVHVRELGDFSVLYRIAGLLEDVKSLITARSRLREAMLDVLHGAGIEIVSPNFMNTRAMAPDALFIPPAAEAPQEVRVTSEEVAFDKAEEAASVDEIRKAIEAVDAEITALAKARDAGETPEDAGETVKTLEARKATLVEQLKTAEEMRKAAEQSERMGGGKG